MTQETRPPVVSRPVLPGADGSGGSGALVELPPLRCADAARMRGEPLHASAVRYARFLLLEVPGPWGPSALDDKHMEAEVARQLAARGKAADTHVLLIRRPGRHPSGRTAPDRVHGLGVRRHLAGAERVLWGAWRDPADLLEPGPDRRHPRPGQRGRAAAAGPGVHERQARPVLRGPRPAGGGGDRHRTGWDTWECSHLGGHRFAATMMLLPTGDMFGWLDPESAVEVMRRFDAGQIVLSHYRGRSGQPVPVQAALHAAAVRLGDFRRDALRVSPRAPSRADGPAQADEADLWDVEVIHRTEHSPGIAYRVVVAGSKLAPTLLSCSDGTPRAEILTRPFPFPAPNSTAPGHRDQVTPNQISSSVKHRVR